MRLPISKEKGPIGRKCEHWALVLGTRNRLSNARENLFPGGYRLSLLALTSFMQVIEITSLLLVSIFFCLNRFFL